VLLRDAPAVPVVRDAHRRGVVNAPAMGRIPPRTITTLMVAGAFHGNTYVATATVQSSDPDNPMYARDTGPSGFRCLRPAAASALASVFRDDTVFASSVETEVWI